MQKWLKSSFECSLNLNWLIGDGRRWQRVLAKVFKVFPNVWPQVKKCLNQHAPSTTWHSLARGAELSFYCICTIHKLWHISQVKIFLGTWRVFCITIGTGLLIVLKHDIHRACYCFSYVLYLYIVKAAHFFKLYSVQPVNVFFPVACLLPWEYIGLSISILVLQFSCHVWGLFCLTELLKSKLTVAPAFKTHSVLLTDQQRILKLPVNAEPTYSALSLKSLGGLTVFHGGLIFHIQG